MINFIRNLFRKTPGTGALADPGITDKTYIFKEIVATANPVNWIEKSQFRKFPIFNQNGSSSCVAQTIVKLLGVMYWLKNQLYVHFSATHVYQRRSNKPNPGMGGVDAFDIAQKGVTLEELVPSQLMTDVQMDGAEIPEYKQKVGEVFKIGNYFTLPSGDIETIASVIQTTGKAIMVWFFFEMNEWTNRPVIKNPNLNNSAPGTARHSVSAVDYALIDGKKCLIIEDSWGTSYGLAGQRIIDEDFYKIRNFFAAYPMNFAFEEQAAPKPKYTFTKDLEFGQTDPDIVQLQNILKYEGFFPTNVQSTGYYGSISSKAVLGFQKKYKVASDDELNQLQGRRVGTKTRDKLNELYGS